MFKNTLGIIDKIISDLKKSLFLIKCSALLFSIGYLVYAIINTKKLIINISLLLINVAYLLFYIICHDKIDSTTKTIRRISKKVFKWSKIAINAVSLIITILAFDWIINESNIIALTLTLVMAVSWLFSLLIELITIFIENRATLIKEAFLMDTRLIADAQDFIGRIKGENIPTREPIKNAEKIKAWAKERKERKRLEKQKNKVIPKTYNSIKEKATK